MSSFCICKRVECICPWTLCPSLLIVKTDIQQSAASHLLIIDMHVWALTHRHTSAHQLGLPPVTGRKHRFCPTGSLTDIRIDGWRWLMACHDQWCVYSVCAPCSNVSTCHNYEWVTSWMGLSVSQFPSCAMSSPSAHLQLDPHLLLFRRFPIYMYIFLPPYAVFFSIDFSPYTDFQFLFSFSTYLRFREMNQTLGEIHLIKLRTYYTFDA